MSAPLHPWYSEEGHPEAPAGGCFAESAVCDYRVRPSEGGFAAECRGKGGTEWAVLSAGHKTAHKAAGACASAEQEAHEIAGKQLAALVEEGQELRRQFDASTAGRRPTAAARLTGLERLRRRQEELKRG